MISLYKQQNMKQNRHSIWNKIKNKFIGQFPRVSYSRTGEDLIMEELFRNKYSGFYVDIGAYDPINFSNTYKYYLKGWRGINIDPSIETINNFNKIRPRDINLNIAVGESTGLSNYFVFENDASMNTISEAFKEEAQKSGTLILSEKREVKIDKLENILNQHLPENKNIDVLSVDVEGIDLEVLKSNNWNKYRPTVICVEVETGLLNISDCEITRYMSGNGYIPIGYTFITKEIGNVIFMENS